MYNFTNITLLVTHYNRSGSLENLLENLREVGCVFNRIVISDDGSDSSHLAKLERLTEEYQFEVVKTETNKGLGNNINKGQDTVTSPLTLYIQEDFEPTTKFPVELQKAEKLLSLYPDVDYIRFYAYFQYPYLRPFTADFSEMHIPSTATNYSKIYMYSDHPHLRRTSFFQKFGRYEEGCKGDRTEYKMCISFIRKKGRALESKYFRDLFVQRNSEVEPSTMSRSSWRNSNAIAIKILRYFYRQVKYNIDLQRP